jgi:energy-coupling factor transport system substrate-specific component
MQPTMALTQARPAPAQATGRWRTVDIVVAAMIGVVFGVIFSFWNYVWTIVAPASAVPPVYAFLVYGVWLVPAVLAPLIVRKPGAAVFAEMAAAGVSTLFGSPWGPDVLLSGFVQGAAAELVFAMTLYQRWSWPVVSLAAIASAAAAWIHDWALWYPTADVTLQVIRAVAMAVSAVVIVAFGSLALERSLRRTGVLDRFGTGTPAGSPAG